MYADMTLTVHVTKLLFANLSLFLLTNLYVNTGNTIMMKAQFYFVLSVYLKVPDVI